MPDEAQKCLCTHRKIVFEILLNKTEIRLYLSFSDCFGTANGQCPFAVPNKSENSKYNLPFKRGHIGFLFQKVAQCYETNKKAIIQFLQFFSFFQIWLKILRILTKKRAIFLSKNMRNVLKRMQN